MELFLYFLQLLIIKHFNKMKKIFLALVLLIAFGANAQVTFQPTFTKISGTVAGTAQLQGSVDGVTYNNVGSAYTLTDVASQTTSFIVTPSTYQFYKLLITPSGTQSTKVKTPVLIRKY